jgi:hypothetical protein
VAIYYFATAGNDAAGTNSQATPWQTISKANGLTLAPGDSLLFKGGDTFSGTLTPSSGVTVASYGTGRATITRNGDNAIALNVVDDVTINNLTLTTTDTGNTGTSGITIGFTGACSNILIINNVISSAKNAGIQLSAESSLCEISANTINGTGDSGIIAEGSTHDINFNTISNTGTNAALTYGKHGIYHKCYGTGRDSCARVSNNTISAFNDGSGISIRREWTRCYNNTIVETTGSSPISFFQAGTATGTVFIYKNTITGVTSGNAGIYIGAADTTAGATVTTADFVIVNNTIVCNGADVGLDLSAEAGGSTYRMPVNIVVKNNLITGTFNFAINAFQPATGKTFTGDYNNWFRTGGGISTGNYFRWNTVAGTFAAFKTASGGAANSKTLDPALNGSNVPTNAAIIDAGTTSVDPGLVYDTNNNPAFVDVTYSGAAPDMGSKEGLSTAPTKVKIWGVDDGTAVGIPDVGTDALSFSVVLEPTVIGKATGSLPAGTLPVTPQVGDYVYYVLAYNQNNLDLTADLPSGYSLIASKSIVNRVALYAARKVWQPGDVVALPNWRVHDATDLELQRNYVLFGFVLRGVDAAKAEVGFSVNGNSVQQTRGNSGMTTITTPPAGAYIAGFFVGKPGNTTPQHTLNTTLTSPATTPSSGWTKRDETLQGTAAGGASITASAYSVKLGSTTSSQAQIVVDVADAGGESWASMVIEIAARVPANQTFQLSGIPSGEKVGRPSVTQSSPFQVIQDPTFMTKASSPTPGGTLAVTPQVNDYVYYVVAFNQSNLGDLSANAPSGWTVVAQRSTTDRVAVYVARRKWQAGDSTTLPTWLIQDSVPTSQARNWTTWSAVLRGVDPTLQEVGFAGFGSTAGTANGNTGVTSIGTLPSNGYLMAFMVGKPGAAPQAHTFRAADSVPTSGWTKSGGTDQLQGTAAGAASISVSAWYQALSGGAQSQGKLAVDFVGATEQYAGVVLEVSPAGGAPPSGSAQSALISGIASTEKVGKPGVTQSGPGGGTFIPGKPSNWNKAVSAGGHIPSLTVFSPNAKFGPQTSDYYTNATVRSQPRGVLNTAATTPENSYYYYPRSRGYTAISITPGAHFQIELDKAPPTTGVNAWTVGAQVYLNDFIGTSAGNLNPKPDGKWTIQSISGTTVTFVESYTLTSGVYNTNSPGYAMLVSQRGGDNYYEVNLTQAQIEAHAVCPQTGTPYFTQDADGYWRWTGGYTNRLVLTGTTAWSLKVRVPGNLDVVNAAPGFMSNIDRFAPGDLNPYCCFQITNLTVDFNGMALLGMCGGTMAYSQNLGGYYLPQGEAISYNGISGVFAGVMNRGFVYDANKIGNSNKNLIWKNCLNYRNELCAGIVLGPNGETGNGGHTDCYQIWSLDNTGLPFGVPTWEWVFMQCGGNGMVFANEAGGSGTGHLIANAWCQYVMAFIGNKWLSLSASQDMGARLCWVNADPAAVKKPDAIEVSSNDIVSHPFTRSTVLFPETTHPDANMYVDANGGMTPIDRDPIPTGWGPPKSQQPPGADFVYVNVPGGNPTPTPQVVSITGLATGELLGKPTLHANITRSLSGIASGELVGKVNRTAGVTRINVNGVASTEKVGKPATDFKRFVNILGISTGELVGKPTLGAGGKVVQILGIASTERVGLSAQKTPHNTRTGAFQPTRGIESVVQFGDLMLNNLMIAALPVWQNGGLLTKITSIAGMADSPDVRDARDPNPEIDGETIYKSLYGGRTVTIEGFVYGQNIDDLQKSVAQMRSSLSVRSEQALTFTPVHNDGAAATEAQVTILCRPTAFSIKEQQTDTQIRRAFQITFRAADPLIRTATVTAPFHKDLSSSTLGTLTVINNGNTDDYPIITVASTGGSSFKGDIENLTSGERMSINQTTNAKINCRSRSITTTSGTIVWGLHRMKSVSGDTLLKQVDWLRLVPGPNSLQIKNLLTGSSPLPDSCTVETSQGAWV